MITIAQGRLLITIAQGRILITIAQGRILITIAQGRIFTLKPYFIHFNLLIFTFWPMIDQIFLSRSLMGDLYDVLCLIACINILRSYVGGNKGTILSLKRV